MPPTPSSVDLYWIPLGAGGHSVRINGRVFELIDAARGHRRRCDLYHAALIVTLEAQRYAIELAPAWVSGEATRGVVGTGSVGSRLPVVARRLLAAVTRVPNAVWGRDELGAGEMWNSNSAIAWLIAMAGIPADAIEPPPGGRAPGWRSGPVVAGREARPAAASPGRSAPRAGTRGLAGSRTR